MPPQMQNQAQSTPYAFSGGLDQASASLAVPGGRVIAGLNYEPTVNGYQRVQGHERFDGRRPSDYHASRLNYSASVGSALVFGNVITGSTSGATAVVLHDYGPAGDGTGALSITNITGVFVNGEGVTLGGKLRVLSSAVYTIPDDADDEYAQNWWRTQIGKPPGSGPVRGGFVLNGSVYAFRDNVGATAGVLYKATPAGWVAQPLGRDIFFSLGIVEIAEGSTITGNTSGATAHVERVIVLTGAWGAALAADQAHGFLVISGQVGAFVNNETLKVGATACATNTSGGNSFQMVLVPGGRYDCKVKNFYGAANRKRVYFANGVGPAFEYDGGSVFVPIVTGMPVDTPSRVFDIANALGLVYPGGSVQISEPGEPCVFNAILGALEIALGDDCTDVVDATDSAVVFFCKEKVSTLTGRGVDTFVLDELSEEAGALPWTAQRIGKTVYLDLRGMRDLTATAAFGNFKAGALSELFDRYLQAKRKAGAQPIASMRVKSKSQYRVYYSDGTGFTVYMGGKLPEMLPFETDAMQVYTTFTGELADGSEGLFGCGSDGYVYRLDSGTSFDGVAVRGFLMLPFNHLGSIGMNKRFHGLTIELDAADRTQLAVVAQFDYGDGEQPISGNQDFSVFVTSDFIVEGGGGDFVITAGGGTFDAATWSDLYWSTAYQGMAEADIAGAGRNVSIIIASPAKYLEQPHTLQSYAIRWSARGPVKRTAQ